VNASIVGKAWLSVSRIPSPWVHWTTRSITTNAGAADAIMLDVEGYVAETNATNLFLVRRRDGGMGIGIIRLKKHYCVSNNISDAIMLF
jgi:hypothetical protein